jgi:hypothetical protein
MSKEMEVDMDNAVPCTAEPPDEETPPEKPIDPIIPDGFFPISEATTRLTKFMFGNLNRAIAVQKAKEADPLASIGLASQRKEAAARLRGAILIEELKVYLLSISPARAERSRRDGLAEAAEAELRLEVLGRHLLNGLLITHGGFPDHPFRPTLRTAGGDEKLLGSLKRGILVVRETEFTAWSDVERAKGTWPSQHSRARRFIGRPSKKTQSLRNTIVAYVNDGRWNGHQGIADLHRLLIERGGADVPSPDTLARLVDELAVETGDRRLLRKLRRPHSRRY